MAENGSAIPKPVKNLLKGSGNIYRIEITNAEYTNRVITDIKAAAGTGNSPIFGVTDIEEDIQVVRTLSFLSLALPPCGTLGPRANCNALLCSGSTIPSSRPSRTKTRVCTPTLSQFLRVQGSSRGSRPMPGTSRTKTVGFTRESNYTDVDLY